MNAAHSQPRDTAGQFSTVEGSSPDRSVLDTGTGFDLDRYVPFNTPQLHGAVFDDEPGDLESGDWMIRRRDQSISRVVDVDGDTLVTAHFHRHCGNKVAVDIGSLGQATTDRTNGTVSRVTDPTLRSSEPFAEHMRSRVVGSRDGVIREKRFGPMAAPLTGPAVGEIAKTGQVWTATLSNGDTFTAGSKADALAAAAARHFDVIGPQPLPAQTGPRIVIAPPFNPGRARTI
jgi:hypothetical protein